MVLLKVLCFQTQFEHSYPSRTEQDHPWRLDLIMRQVSRLKSQSFALLDPRIATTRFFTSGSLHDTTRAIWRTGATNSSSMFSSSVLRVAFFTSVMMSSLLFSQLAVAKIVRSRAKSWLPSKGCSRSSSFRKLDDGCLTYFFSNILQYIWIVWSRILSRIVHQDKQ